MQETLELTNKLKIPDINTGMLNSSADFLCKLNDFNRQWDTDISVQNSGRWQQGSYDKFKALAIHSLNPRMEKARTIKNIFQSYSYNFNALRDKLKSLDIELKDIRNSGIKFNDNNDTEGKERLATLIDNLQKSINNHPEFHVELSRIPWFHKLRRKSAWPVFNLENELDGFAGEAERYADTFVNPTNDNPNNVYLNIAIPLSNIQVNIFHQKANDDLLYKYDYGSLMVCQSISLFDAILITRRIENKATRGLYVEKHFKGTTYKFPLYSALEHPFVSQSSDIYNGYGTGNTCFGDLTDQIFASIASGHLSRAKTFLDIWASTYPKNNVNPLNRYDSSIFGGPLNFKKGHEDDSISSNPERCKRQVDEYHYEINQQDFIETFCSNCRFIETCKTYKDWTYVERVLTEEEQNTLNEFSSAVFESDGPLQSHWHNDKQAFQKLMRSTYLYFGRKFEQFETCGVFLGKLRVRHKGRGQFFTDIQWIEAINDLEAFDSLSVSTFIKWYYIAEGIWYHALGEELGFLMEGSPESTEEEIKISIRRARNVHINLQQRNGTSVSGLNTYAKLVFH